VFTYFLPSRNPNKPKSIPIDWPKYDLNNQQYIALKPNMTIGTKLRAEYVAFWNDFVPEVLQSVPMVAPCTVTSDGFKNTPGKRNVLVGTT
jgi:hypothetical protein